MSDRRQFLRGLASLPLIGGSVALLGNPTAAAVTPTRQMLVGYADWLLAERQGLLYELNGRAAAEALSLPLPYMGRNHPWRAALGSPSSRAAVILSAAGLPLHQG